ncbi:MAG: hypothetical protein HC789_23930, partial [Microcoleus sp. CSU_2_2]|nr:hypothetical protein [Microcoleus sp. CSU_2_2]
DLFVLSPSAGFDNIFSFQADRDYFGLTGNLTFDQLQIAQGTDNYTNDALISIAESGEQLAWLKDFQFDLINSSHFVTYTPDGTLPEAFNTPSNIDPLTGEPVDSEDVGSEADDSLSGGIDDGSLGSIPEFAPSQNSTTVEESTFTLEGLTTGTEAGILTATDGSTTTDDILLNGGSIPSMNFEDQNDDDILIYDNNNSLFGSVSSTQTQPIIPLNGTTVNSGISPTANTSASDNDLLITPAASPSDPLANSDLTGISIV